MDLLVEAEASQVDPATPFRAVTGHLHHTWARTWYSHPELYFQPRSTEEIQKIVVLARRCRRRLAITGCAHSPSDLTCTSSWLVNLDYYDKILHVDSSTREVVMQAGIRIHDLQSKMKDRGLMMPNEGSIDHQSIAGALGTCTHGSSTRHGNLAQSVSALKIMLANGETAFCSRESNVDLFRAALVSLGSLGIILEVTFQMAPYFNIEWSQSLEPLDDILAQWEKGLWTENEYIRLWWFPYMRRAVRWRANKTAKSPHPPVSERLNVSLPLPIYQLLLYIAQFIPRLLPAIEKLVVGLQFGFKNGVATTGVEDGHTGLLLAPLCSQFVNEWCLDLHKGPEAISRLTAWLHGDEVGSRIPFSSKGIYVHCPIEVRVTDGSSTTPRPYLDTTVPDRTTLYFNATIHRPFHCDPPFRDRYYQAFEYLMKELGGKPHWAKCFSNVSREEFEKMYPFLDDWRRVRDDVDPEGMFVGDWVRRNLLADSRDPVLPLEEREDNITSSRAGGKIWSGLMPAKGLRPRTSDESFEMMHVMESEKSSLLRN